MSWQPIANAEHHDGTGETSTGLKKAAKGIEKYRHYKDAKHEDTDALRLGRITHVLIFEPQNLESLTDCCPLEDDGTVTHKKGKEKVQRWADFGDGLNGRDWYKPAELARCKEVAAAVHANPVAAEWMRTGVAEVSGVVDSRYGKLKIRPDHRCSERRVILDAKKTVKDLDDESIEKTIAEYSYDLSAALYVDVADQIEPGEPYRFIWIFVLDKKNEPISVRCVEASAELLSVGRHQYLESLERIHQAKESGCWLDPHSMETTEIGLPYWHVKRVTA